MFLTVTTITPHVEKMSKKQSKKGRGVLVQVFPDVSVERWKGLVQDLCSGWNEHFSAICKPDQPAVQLKAVKKVCRLRVL